MKNKLFDICQKNDISLSSEQLEQFEMFDKNIDWYMDNWKDNFSDYINDLMRIAVSDIERKKLTDIYEEMRKIMKESSKKRG